MLRSALDRSLGGQFADQRAHHDTGRNHPENGRDKHCGAFDQRPVGAGVEVVVLAPAAVRARRAQALEALRVPARRDGQPPGFRAENRRHSRRTGILARRPLQLLTQVLADRARQRVTVGREQVRDAHLRRVQLARGAHRRDDRDVQLLAAVDQVRLRGDVVDRVDDEIWLGVRRQQRLGVLGLVERLHSLDRDLRVDLAAALRQQLRLGLADSALQRLDLPVHVGRAHDVVIHQRQLADARSREALHGEAAHAAHAKNHDVRSLQPVKPGLGRQPHQPVKAPLAGPRPHRSAIFLRNDRLLCVVVFHRLPLRGREMV